MSLRQWSLALLPLSLLTLTACSGSRAENRGIGGEGNLGSGGEPLGSLVLSCRSALTLGAPCPSIVPNAGAACDSPGMACPPSACEDSIAVCTNGVWQWNQSNLCPVCASPDTPIATPFGERAIAELRVGDLVYSVDDGAILPVPLVSVGKTPVTHHHVNSG